MRSSRSEPFWTKIHIQRESFYALGSLLGLALVIIFFPPQSLLIVTLASLLLGSFVFSIILHVKKKRLAILVSIAVCLLAFLRFSQLLDIQTLLITCACICAIAFYLYS